MSTKAVRPTAEEILVARQQHPEMGGRRLARYLLPDDASERQIVNLASRVNRLVKKHGLDRVDETSTVDASDDAPSTPDASDDERVERSADDDHRAQLERDLKEARALVREMRSARVFGPVPPTLKHIRSLEEQVTALRRRAEQTHASDIDAEYVVQRLRELPRSLLEAALASD